MPLKVQAFELCLAGISQEVTCNTIGFVFCQHFQYPESLLAIANSLVREQLRCQRTMYCSLREKPWTLLR